MNYRYNRINKVFPTIAPQLINSYPYLEAYTNASTPAYDDSGPAWS